jgi:predicted SprT family Zn-dependent metalloprotease
MLNPSDNLRARFAPNDPVHFKYRRKMLKGTLVRSNPKRAIIRVKNEEYIVPYEVLIPNGHTGVQRAERIDAIHALALGLMREHGLSTWEFKFDHSTRRAGCCNYHDRCLSISFDLARSASEEDIRDTLLHEIAHALVGNKQGHNTVWKEKAREIGCSGERCHRLQFAPPRYTVTCENRCWTHSAERRNRRLICRTCSGKLIYAPYGAKG